MSKRGKAPDLYELRGKEQVSGERRTAPRVLHATALLAGALLVCLVVYSPAVRGPFVFDDIGLPFYVPGFPHDSVRAWVSGVRPFLNLTYWLNYQWSGREPWSYHLLNLALHAANSTLLLALIRRVLSAAGVESRRAGICALAAASVFLVHPLASESVAYVAGRSELVCGLFTLAALVVFFGGGHDSIRPGRAAAVLVLYGCAVMSKEQAAVLPLLLLALDTHLRRRSVSDSLRRGAWLYGPLALAAAVAAAVVGSVLSRSTTAGFQVPGVHWYEYLFTQFRVWLRYMQLAIIPADLRADYDIPLSHTLAEHGSAVGALILAAAGILVYRNRLRFPVLFTGTLLFTILLLPTSSLVPLQDLVAERRMYLPLAGLVLGATEFLMRARHPGLTGIGVAAYLICCAVLTQQRAAVWGSDIRLWTHVVQSSPLKVRGYTHLTYAYMRAGRCAAAVDTAASAPAAVRQDAMLMAVLGQAYLCDRRPVQAAEAYERAVLIEPSLGRMLALAVVYRQMNRAADAESMERNALRYPPRSAYDQSMLLALHGSRSRSADPPGLGERH